MKNKEREVVKRSGNEQEKKEKESFKKKEKGKGKEKENSSERKNKRKRLNFMQKKKEIERVVLSRESLLVLLYKEAYFNLNKINENLLGRIVFVLQDYKDVFHEEVPDGLPPLIGIEHQIDFLLETIIPYRPAYRCNSKETKELQRKIEDLMKKGYVRESFSACTILVLLVPKKDGTL